VEIIGRRRELCGQRVELKIGSWKNWAVEARKFAVRVKK